MTPNHSNEKVKTDTFSQKKQLLLEEAALLILKKGFFATSMNEIAAKLGINKASLYHYCSSKDEIAIDIQRLNVEYVTNIFEEAEVNCENGMEKLRYFWLGYTKLMTTPIGAAGIQIAAMPHSKALEESANLLFKEANISVRGYLIEGQADGSIASVNAEWSDFVLFGVLHWIPRWYSNEGSLDPEQLGNQLFDVILSGLLPR